MANIIFDRILHTEHMIKTMKDQMRTGARGARGAARQLKDEQARLTGQLLALTDEQLMAFAAYRKTSR